MGVGVASKAAPPADQCVATAANVCTPLGNKQHAVDNEEFVTLCVADYVSLRLPVCMRATNGEVANRTTTSTTRSEGAGRGRAVTCQARIAFTTIVIVSGRPSTKATTRSRNGGTPPLAEGQSGDRVTVGGATAARAARCGRSSQVSAVCLQDATKGVCRPRKERLEIPANGGAKTDAALVGSVPTATEKARAAIKSRCGQRRRRGQDASQSGARPEGSLRSQVADAIVVVSHGKAAVFTTTIAFFAETAT